MKYAILMTSLILVALTLSSAHAEEEPAQVKYAIKAGKILMMTPAKDSDTGQRVINNGIILVGNGKIEALGPASTIKVPEGYVIIDASDRWVMPGIVEAHTHIGIDLRDGNDMVTPINPELHIVSCIDSEHITLKSALTGGITTVHIMPGSGTNMAGFTVIIKLDTSCPEKMILRELSMMKATQAYNPERRGGDLGLTRMGMSWSLRQMLKRAKEYADAWQAYERGESKVKPEYKPEWEKVRKVFSGEIPTIVHTYEGWGVMQTIRMFNDENNLKVIATHTAGGGYMIGKEAAKRDGVSINIGPRVVDFSWGAEYDGRFHGMGAEYNKAGVKNLSINTDATRWGRQEELALQAAMSARLGLDELVAMEAITINSARALGIEDRVGSLETGKDADIVIKKSSLLDITTPVDLVMINGKITYQRNGVDMVAKERQDSI